MWYFSVVGWIGGEVNVIVVSEYDKISFVGFSNIKVNDWWVSYGCIVNSYFRLLMILCDDVLLLWLLLGCYGVEFIDIGV